MQIDSLMGHFQNQTGSQYNNGSSSHVDMMTQMVASKLGINIPPALLQKLCGPFAVPVLADV